MPYLHWEEERIQHRRAHLLRWAEKHLKASPDQEDESQSKLGGDKGKGTCKESSKKYSPKEILALRFQVNGEELTADEKLMLFYLYDDRPIHLRRTLDQSYDYMLEGTKDRDDGQVVSRHMKKLGYEKPRLIMVDQLWLWIVEGS
jgi:hypothetical protein